MELGGYTEIGPRDANEDSFYFRSFADARALPGGIDSFIMVSDGMGGYEGGDIASSLAVSSAESYLAKIAQMVEGNEIEFDAAAALGEIVQNAHEAILAESRERGNSSMGATFVGAFLSADHAWIGHVGDSRAYLIRGGEAVQLTEDHSQVGRMLSRGLITEEEAQNHPARNRIERALGFSDGNPELDEVDIVEGDALLLCSDGVYTVLNADALCRCVEAARGAGSAAKRVVKTAIGKGTDDNSTAVVALNVADEGSHHARQPTIRTGAVERAPRRSRPAHRAQPTSRTPPQGQAHARGGAAMQDSGSSQARKRSGRSMRSIIAPVAVAVLLVGLLFGFFVGSGGFNAGGSAGGGQDSAAQGANGADAASGQAQQQVAQPQAALKAGQPVAVDGEGQAPGGQREFTVTGQAQLKYLDASGRAQNFSGDDEAPFTADGAWLELLSGALVEASDESNSYHRDYEYRMLDDKYLRALEDDLASYGQGVRSSFDSALSRVVSESDYLSFLEALSGSANSNFTAVKHLIVFADDLS